MNRVERSSLGSNSVTKLGSFHLWLILLKRILAAKIIEKCHINIKKLGYDIKTGKVKVNLITYNLTDRA